MFHLRFLYKHAEFEGELIQSLSKFSVGHSEWSESFFLDCVWLGYFKVFSKLKMLVLEDLVGEMKICQLGKT